MSWPELQPALRSIFVLELSLLRHRDLMETESELTLEQGEALNLFLHRYSSSLTNTVDAKLDARSGPTLLDDFAQRLGRAFQDHDSANSAAILDYKRANARLAQLIDKRN